MSWLYQNVLEVFVHLAAVVVKKHHSAQISRAPIVTKQCGLKSKYLAPREKTSWCLITGFHVKNLHFGTSEKQQTGMYLCIVAAYLETTQHGGNTKRLSTTKWSLYVPARYQAWRPHFPRSVQPGLTRVPPSETPTRRTYGEAGRDRRGPQEVWWSAYRYVPPHTGNWSPPQFCGLQ